MLLPNITYHIMCDFGFQEYAAENRFYTVLANTAVDFGMVSANLEDEGCKVC
jgi:hypothetical protein